MKSSSSPVSRSLYRVHPESMYWNSVASVWKCGSSEAWLRYDVIPISRSRLEECASSWRRPRLPAKYCRVTLASDCLIASLEIASNTLDRLLLYKLLPPDSLIYQLNQIDENERHYNACNAQD